MTVLEELDLIVIAMCLNAGDSNSITNSVRSSASVVFSELFIRALSLDKGRNYTF